MLSHLGIAIVTFAVTNIDDLLILSVYFANAKYKTKNVVVGQYLGISALIVVSFIGPLLGEFLADHWISLLGILPLGLGVKDLLSGSTAEDEAQESETDSGSRLQFLGVAFVTIANGGDNIGVYAPLFANVTLRIVSIYIIVFMLLTAIWCALAFYFVRHPDIKRLFSRYGKMLLPFFLIALGLFIMKDFLVWIF